MHGWRTRSSERGFRGAQHLGVLEHRGHAQPVLPLEAVMRDPRQRQAPAAAPAFPQRRRRIGAKIESDPKIGSRVPGLGDGRSDQRV